MCDACKNSTPPWLYAAVIALAATASYIPVWNNDFVSYDDYKYISENPFIKGGLSIASVKWAFSSFYFSNWHPITWLSYLSDVSLYGFSARGYHVTSLLIHVLNAVVLFFALCAITSKDRTLECAIVAALFAVHPLNVESVAWVSERKNCLCAFFWFITLAAYGRYVNRQTLLRYLTTLSAFSLALMSKPMAVTLPFTLLLIDYWPCGRFKAGQTVIGKYPIAGLIAEKIPFFLLSFVSSVITVYAQRQEGAIITFNQLALSFRIINAVMSYAGYIGKTFVPSHLAVFYPYLEEKSSMVIAAAAIMLIAVTVLVFIRRKTAPYLLVGWLWYLGTLVPSIQIVAVGTASMADRYMYIPEIGIFIIIAWGAAPLLRQHGKVLVPAAAIVALTAVTYFQSRYWRDSATLYKHAIEVTEGNYLAHNNYGQLLMKQGKFDEAVEQFKKGLDIMPTNEELNYNMWQGLAAKGTPDDKYLINASSIWFSGDAAALYKKTGISYFNSKKYNDAVGFFLKSLMVNKKDAEGFNYLGLALQETGQLKEAAMAFNKAVELSPSTAVFHFNKAAALIKTGDNKTAAAALRQSLQLDPENAAARQALKEIE